MFLLMNMTISRIFLIGFEKPENQVTLFRESWYQRFQITSMLKFAFWEVRSSIYTQILTS